MRSNLGEERDYLSFGFTIYYKGKPSQEPGVKNGSRDHRGILLTNLIDQKQKKYEAWLI